MLMQNFKSAADLDISEVEHQSLVKVLGMLEREELVHGVTPMAKIKRAPNEFNMACGLDSGCGTIGCIAGWAHVLSGNAVFPEIVDGDIGDWDLRANEPLYRLFGINCSIGWLNRITPDQAATALRSYLTTGDARWDLALA